MEWLGADTDMGLGAPDAIIENVVNFELHPAPGTDAEQLVGPLLRHVAPFLEEYIWSKEAFTLHTFPSSHIPPWLAKTTSAANGSGKESPTLPSLPPFLWGSVGYGDNVDDEWFIVWLLLELTRAFGVSARVWDNDGEFLLIEAAYALPRWAKPHSIENRVWLHKGRLHLVPLPRKNSADPPEWAQQPLSLAAALQALRGENGGSAARAAGDAAHAAVGHRLEGFPTRAAGLMHRARAVLPARLAAVLKKRPQAVAAAVDAFYLRDPGDIRVAARMAFFPPEHMVLTSVTFSRCLFAQVSLQEYSPPRGWPQLPLPSHPDHAPALLGAKLAAGFEILLAENEGAAAGEVAALAAKEFDAAALAAAPVPPSDGEAWMYDAPDDLEAELKRREEELQADQRRGKQKNGVGVTSGAATAQGARFDPEELASRVQQFMEAVAGPEGASVPPHRSGIAFDERTFFAELQRTLGIQTGVKGRCHPAMLDEDDGEDEDASSDEGSSFYNGSGSDSSSEEGRNSSGGGIDDPWAAAETATDSDDECEAGFMANYSQALEAQLAGTTLAESFVRQEHLVGGAEVGTSALAAEAPREGGEAAVEEAGLRPVDVDTNLVASLLASYQEAGGLSGPASNLAGLLGVRLPDLRQLEEEAQEEGEERHPSDE